MRLSARDRGSNDDLFDDPYIDLDEWRDEPIRHRFVHGGFHRTDARFAMYFPQAERYQGRFFQPLMPVSGTEYGAATGVLTHVAGLGGYIGFCADSGAYLVESNQGYTTPLPGDVSVSMHRTSAAVARYSRTLAAEMYGDHRPFGYIYGGSGGAFKTMSCVENHYDVWDGAMPFVAAHPKAMPTMLIAPSHLFRVLGDKIDGVAAALAPGGSGNPFEGLDAEQRAALAELTRLGYDPRIWFDHERIAAQYQGGVWSMLVQNVINGDPEYFEDFWSVAGYLGADEDGSVAKARIKQHLEIVELVDRDDALKMGIRLPLSMLVAEWTEGPVAVRLSGLPDVDLRGGMFTFADGVAKGRQLNVVDWREDVVVMGTLMGGSPLANVEIGDSGLLDNSIYLACQTHHRHIVHPDFPQWDQFQVNGKPIYPQRPLHHIGPMPARQTGRFACKMIQVSCLMDEAAVPMASDYYRRLVEAELGERTDDHYRLWYVDNAMHTVPVVEPTDSIPLRTTRIVNYMGVLHQGLRDLVAWVEHDIAPPPSTSYEIVDTQVVIPSTAAERRGIQPVPTLTVNGTDSATIRAGDSVTFVGTAEAPPKAGPITRFEWDFDGTGQFPESRTHLNGGEGHLSKVTHQIDHTFGEPGTYFPAMRVTVQREGVPDSPYARVQNIARVKVTVTSR